MKIVEIDPTPWVKTCERLLYRIDQLPYVFSELINTAAFNTRRVLVESTWPTHVTVRNTNFLSASLRVDKATKTNLTVRIYDALNRGHLQQHAVGGIVTPRSSRQLSIPNPREIRRGAHGVPQRSKLESIVRSTPRRALRITDRGVFAGQAGRLHLKYSFKPSVQLPASVPFYETFQDVMRRDMAAGFTDQMRKAMQTAR